MTSSVARTKSSEESASVAGTGVGAPGSDPMKPRSIRSSQLHVRGLLVGLGLARRDVKLLGHGEGDRPVDERDAEPLGEGRRDHRAPGAVGRR